MYGLDKLAVITSALVKRRLRGRVEVFVKTQLNTTEDDLQFELLLCLASTIEVIQRLHPTDASEIQRANAFMPTRVKTNTSKNDLDVALLECLTNTIEAIQSLLPTGADGGGKALETESDRVLNITQGKWQPRSHGLAFSPGSD
jgi:hypothetical protein